MSDPVGVYSPLRRRRKLGKISETFPQNESFLPDDIVTDILSMLPPKDVLRYQCVCKGWRDLTSTRDFTDFHFHRSVPMILNLKEPTMLDGCWESARTRSTIIKVYKPYEHLCIYFSHNGLIVSGTSFGVLDFVIYNPVYTDVVNITVKPFTGEVCGVFFHPVQQEFCILLEVYQSFEPKIQYKILNLEYNPNCRDIGNLCTLNRRIWHIQPVLIDKYLYWLVKPSQVSTFYCEVVEYDTGKEDFRVLPCPSHVNLHNYHMLNLVDNDGVVSVIQVIRMKGFTEINMWTLKDDGEQLWTSSNYIISCDVYTHYNCITPKAFAIRNGELVFPSEGKLYVCNLKLGTFRKFGQTYSPVAEFLSHVPSLVSLRNCQRNIRIVEKDENNHMERGNG